VAAGHDSGSHLAGSGSSLVAVSARNETRGTVIASQVEVGTSLWARFMGLMGRP